MSAKLAIIVFQQQLGTMQGVLHQENGVISAHMVQWAERVLTGSIVIVRGRVKEPEQKIKGCTKHDVEIAIDKLHVVARRPEQVPFTKTRCPRPRSLMAEMTRKRAISLTKRG